MSNSKNTCSCLLCKNELSAAVLDKHYNHTRCKKGKLYRPSITNSCEYCQLSFNTMNTSQKANHSRWCNLNPKSAEYKATNNGSQLQTKTVIIKRTISIKKAHTDGKYTGSQAKSIATRRKNGAITHTSVTKLKMSVSALASNHQRVCRSTHQYIDKSGRVFKFDSKWEDAMANRLDELNVTWDRPKPIPYQLSTETKIRRYFADFYLPDYDLYLDPKNSYCEEQQKEKLSIVSKTINLIIIRSLAECKNYTPPEK